MHITVFGATGLVGKRIVQQALNKGFEVTAFGKSVVGLIDADIRNKQLTAYKGYIFNAQDVFNALEKSTAVIAVLGGAIDGNDKTRSIGIKNIIEQMQKKGLKKIVALGGMGILNAADGGLIIDKEDYPEQFIPVGREHQKAFEYLQASSLEWSFFCPPNIIDADETGLYITSTNYPPEPNNYKINAGDLALEMLQTVYSGKFIHERVGISAI